MTPYIAIVQQPAVASVILLDETGRKQLLFQHARSWCEGYARAAADYEAGDDGKTLEIRCYHCAAGETLELPWILID